MYVKNAKLTSLRSRSVAAAILLRHKQLNYCIYFKFFETADCKNFSITKKEFFLKCYSFLVPKNLFSKIETNETTELVSVR